MTYFETYPVILLRITRVQIKRRAIDDAAVAFHETVQMRPPSLTAGQNIQVQWNLLEGNLVWQADEDIPQFFGRCIKEFNSDVPAEGWLRLAEANALFSRSLVQAGKRSLAEAIELSQRAGDHSLWLYVSYAKLFKYFSQHYRDVREWIQDVLNAAATCFDDDEAIRLSFAQSIRSIISRYDAAPLRSIDAEIRNLEQYWSTDAFVVAVYSVWKTANTNGLRIDSIKTVATRLREKGSFLDPLEFESFGQ